MMFDDRMSVDETDINLIYLKSIGKARIFIFFVSLYLVIYNPFFCGFCQHRMFVFPKPINTDNSLILYIIDNSLDRHTKTGTKAY